MLRFPLLFSPWYSPTGAGGGTADPVDQDEQEPEDDETEGGDAPEEPDFDSWLSGQDAAIKSMLDSHTHGLKSALQSERDERSKLAKQVKDLAKSAEKGSELEAQLQALSGEMAEQSVKAAAYETLSAAGIRNLKLAYLAAKDSGLVSDNGTVDLVKLKASNPELFTRPALRTKAGTGTGKSNAPATSINSLIRSKAGR